MLEAKRLQEQAAKSSWLAEVIFFRLLYISTISDRFCHVFLQAKPDVGHIVSSLAPVTSVAPSVAPEQQDKLKLLLLAAKRNAEERNIPFNEVRQHSLCTLIVSYFHLQPLDHIFILFCRTGRRNNT